jgi:cystathionine beta-lyase family protein involved in aluminum resistance
MKDKIYIGTYKVVKIFRRSGRREILRKGLTIDEAKRVVNSYPDSNNHMVVFMKQYTAEKYFQEV